MALAGTKATSTALTHPPDDQVGPGDSTAPKSSTLWQTLKPFGWQGLLLVGVLIVLYAPVLKVLVRQWYTDADYSHGFLVPLLSLYLIWQRRGKLREVARRPSPWGMLVVLLSVGLLFLGSLGAELFLTRISMLGTICGLIAYFCGGALLRAMAFPLVFLLFAIPIPEIGRAHV